MPLRDVSSLTDALASVLPENEDASAHLRVTDSQVPATQGRAALSIDPGASRAQAAAQHSPKSPHSSEDSEQGDDNDGLRHQEASQVLAGLAAQRRDRSSSSSSSSFVETPAKKPLSDGLPDGVGTFSQGQGTNERQSPFQHYQHHPQQHPPQPKPQLPPRQQQFGYPTMPSGFVQPAAPPGALQLHPAPGISRAQNDLDGFIRMQVHLELGKLVPLLATTLQNNLQQPLRNAIDTSVAQAVRSSSSSEVAVLSNQLRDALGQIASLRNDLRTIYSTAVRDDDILAGKIDVLSKRVEGLQGTVASLQKDMDQVRGLVAATSIPQARPLVALPPISNFPSSNAMLTNQQLLPTPVPTALVNNPSRSSSRASSASGVLHHPHSAPPTFYGHSPQLPQQPIPVHVYPPTEPSPPLVEISMGRIRSMPELNLGGESGSSNNESGSGGC